MEHFNEQVVAHLSQLLSEGRSVGDIEYSKLETAKNSPCYVKPHFRKRFSSDSTLLNKEESVVAGDNIEILIKKS